MSKTMSAYQAAISGHAQALAYNAKLYASVLDDIQLDFAGKTVLDVACGHSNPFFTERMRTARHIIGLDCNAAELARNTLIQEAVHGDVHAMPVPDASVDVIVSCNTVEHCDDPGAFIRECSRVLKPGGTAVFTTPNLWGYKTLIAKFCGKYLFNWIWLKFHGRTWDEYDSLYRANTANAVRRVARQAGLNVREIRYVPEVTHFFYCHPILFAAGDLYNRVTGAVGMCWLWSYFAFVLVRPK